MEPHRKGDLTEAIVVAELKRRGVPVSRPVGDNERYDLVAESAERLWRLQVKTGNLSDGVVRFRGFSQHTNAEGNTYKPYDDDIDYFLIYCHELETMYLVPEELVGHKMQLRVEEPNQRDRRINWAEEYAFDDNWPPEVGPPTPTETTEPIVRRLEGEGTALYLPNDTGSRYDAVANSAGTLHRLAFEGGWIADGRLRFGRDGAGVDESVDYVLVYCGDLDELYVIPRESYDSTITLRVDEPKQADSRINWAGEYAFDVNWPP